MSKKYAIHVRKDTLELIQVLNNGGDVAIEQRSTYFVFEVDPPTTVKNQDIVFENDLYLPNGHLKDVETIFV